jgi:hypothetical protein
MTIAKWRADNELITLDQFGPNDFSVNYWNADCSVRGTLLEVMQEIEETFGLENLKEAEVEE